MVSYNKKRYKAKKKSRKLWSYNKRCANCGKLLTNHKIRAVETGDSYCSNRCASSHVNRVYKG